MNRREFVACLAAAGLVSVPAINFGNQYKITRHERYCIDKDVKEFVVMLKTSDKMREAGDRWVCSDFQFPVDAWNRMTPKQREVAWESAERVAVSFFEASV